MSYLGRFLNASDPTASLRHACYLLVVVSGICWLTWAARKDIDANWVAAFVALLAAVTTGKIVGKPEVPSV